MPALVPPERARSANRWITLAATGAFLLLAFRQSAVVPATLGSTWSFLIVMATGGLWLLTRRFERDAPRLADGAFLTGAFYIATSLVSTGWAMHRGLPYGASATNMDLVMIRDVIVLAYFGFLLSNFVTFAAVKMMISVIVVGVTLSSAYALIQVATGVDLAAVIVPPLTKNGGQTLTDNLLREGMLRPAGAAGHPLELSFLVTLTFPLALALVFAAIHRRRRAWPWLLACLIIGAALLSSLSRSAIIGSAAALVAMSFFWSRRRSVSVFAGISLGGLAVLTARPDLLSTLVNVFVTSETDDSLHSRSRALTYSVDMMIDSPILGCGHGCLVEPFHPVLDNQFLGRLIEGGLLGLLSFAVLLCAPLYTAARAARLFDRDASTPEATAHELSIGLVGSVVSIIVINFVLDTTGFVQSWTTMWIILALCWTMCRLAAATCERPQASDYPSSGSKASVTSGQG